METQTRTMLLECDLTDAEVTDRGFEAAQLDQDIQKLEDEFDAVKAAHKGEVKHAEARRRHLLREVRTKKTERDVEVQIEPIFPAGVVRTTRLDTGAILHERPLTDAERQGHLVELGVEDVEAEEGEGAAS